MKNDENRHCETRKDIERPNLHGRARQVAGDQSGERAGNQDGGPNRHDEVEHAGDVKSEEAPTPREIWITRQARHDKRCRETHGNIADTGRNGEQTR